MIENLPIKIDDLGRIVIPKKVRRIMNIKRNDRVLLSLKDDELILKLDKETEKYQKLEKKLLKIKDQYKFDIILTNEEKIIFTTKKYKEIRNNKYLKNILTEKINISRDTKLTKNFILKEEHCYGLIPLDNYKHGILIIVLNNSENKEKAKTIIELLQ